MALDDSEVDRRAEARTSRRRRRCASPPKLQERLHWIGAQQAFAIASFDACNALTERADQDHLRCR
jgi:hypothetical protein